MTNKTEETEEYIKPGKAGDVFTFANGSWGWHNPNTVKVTLTKQQIADKFEINIENLTIIQ